MLIWLLKALKMYMNCCILAVVMGIILSIIGNFLNSAQKHDSHKIEHYRLGLYRKH